MVLGCGLRRRETIVSATHVVEERRTSIRQINGIRNVLDERLL